MGRCRRSGRSPDGRAGRAATGRTRRSRRGTISAAAGPRLRDSGGGLDLPLYLCAVQRDAALVEVFKPVRPPTTFEETVERLGTAIRLGLLPAGSRLPAERDLAEQLGISRSTLREALTTLVQSGHLVAQRGRTGGTFVAERPPLAEQDDKPLGEATWAVLDYRVAVEAGATILAAERAEPDQLERLGELVSRMARRDRLRGVPPGRHALPHRDRGGGELAPAGGRDDRGPGADERPDRADRASGAGAHALERPAPATGDAAAQGGRLARGAL